MPDVSVTGSEGKLPLLICRFNAGHADPNNVSTRLLATVHDGSAAWYPSRTELPLVPGNVALETAIM